MISEGASIMRDVARAGSGEIPFSTLTQAERETELRVGPGYDSQSTSQGCTSSSKAPLNIIIS